MGINSTPVARNFQTHHQQNSDLLSFCVLDTVPANIRGGNRTQDLRRLESRYIIQYQTMAQWGHNCDEKLAVHLR